MTVTVEASALSAAIRAAAAVVESRNTLPILSNVLLRAAGDVLEIAATDLDLEYRARVPLVGPGDLATTVDARLFAGFLARLDKGARLTLALDGGRLTLASGRRRSALHTLPTDDFPALPARDLPSAVELPGKALAATLSRVRCAISTEVTRHYLNGVFLNAEDGQVRATATDGHRLACYALGVDWPEGAPEIIVPRKGVGEIVKLCDGADAPARLEWNGSKWRCTLGDVTLTGKTIDGTFPDYRRVIPAADGAPLTFDPATLSRAVEFAATVCSDKTRAVKLEWSAAGSRITVSAVSAEHGTAEEEVPAAVDADGSSGFNGAYLREALEALGGETVTLHQHDAGSPALLRRQPADAALFVVMPRRV